MAEQPLFRTSNVTLAEYARLLLAAEDIRAAVIQGDPMRLGLAVVDVVVLTEEHKRAKRILDARTSHTEDWNCPDCESPVPMTFDFCWNCGGLHPEIAAEDIAPTRLSECVYGWEAVAC